MELEGIPGRPQSVLSLAGPHLSEATVGNAHVYSSTPLSIHPMSEQQETVHSLLLSAGDEEGSDKAPPILP